jgi:hypothetical protein
VHGQLQDARLQRAVDRRNAKGRQCGHDWL